MHAYFDDPEQVLIQFRDAISHDDLRTANRLRLEWKEWQGEDCIWEMAFGEPVDE